MYVTVTARRWLALLLGLGVGLGLGLGLGLGFFWRKEAYTRTDISANENKHP